MALPELAAPADVVLEKARLALVHSHRHAAARHGILQVTCNLQLVEPVPHLVNGAENGTCKRVFVVMVGNSHVAVAVVVRVGMLALAHHRLIFIEEHNAAEIFAERLLFFRGESARGKSGVNGLLRGEHLFYERNELALYEIEKFVILISGHAALVFVEQNVVSFKTLRLLPHDVFAVIFENFFEIRFYDAEIARSFCPYEIFGIAFQKHVLICKVFVLGNFGELVADEFCLFDLMP